MSTDHENLHQDTGIPDAPLAPTEIGVLWGELARTNALILEFRKMIFTGLRQLASDLATVEQKVKDFDARATRDRGDRISRQAHLDRLLWAGIGIAAAHLLLEAVRLIWQHDRG